ncbi:MAG: urease accessory protein UreE [Gammaproteobacteria bacterium]|nr:urease accessory protein UreE [Gammaproteobacteria bacterium]
MLRIEEKLTQVTQSQSSLTLPFDLRQKSRLRARLDDGREVALILPRGYILRSGECLRAEDGTVVAIKAALETVSLVRSEDPVLLARACYHLGNRHVPLQIGPGWCRYLHDHVLDAMVQGLGLNVGCELAAFEPENGAYGQGTTRSHHHSPHADQDAHRDQHGHSHD